MNFNHATQWETLLSLIDGKFIKPSAFSQQDFSNPVFVDMRNAGIECIWFSTQVWSGSIFGPYSIEYKASDLVLATLVPLGQHNGARCYLSAPDILAHEVAKLLKVSTCGPTDPGFKQRTKSDRIDLLVPWNVPLSNTVHVVMGDTGRPREDNANYAAARLLGLMLRRGNHRFDQCLTEYFGKIDAAAGLLGELVGQVNKFDRRTPGHQPLQQNPSVLLNLALDHFIANRIDDARAVARSIGPVVDVAKEVAVLCGSHFSITLDGKDLENRI